MGFLGETVPVIHFFKRRPLIVLTLLYVLTLILLDRAGKFAATPAFPSGGALSTIEGTVTATPEKKGDRTSFSLVASAIDGRQCRERLLVTSYIATDVTVGDVLHMNGALKTPPGLRNEGGFDYRTYLQRQGIHLLFYPRSIEITGHRRLSPLTTIATGLRDDIVSVIRANLPDVEASVLAPMLVGDKSGLTTELSRAFTDAGVMHVLVVTGTV
jgi:competence protein ComEC